MKKLSLGIDTSNYRTSVAVVSEDGRVLFNVRDLLPVKQGERGLRQSDAFFMHVQRLPGIIRNAFSDPEIYKNIGAVSVSSKPRPVEGSYMPVFTAGMNTASVIASSLNIPYYEFSHQAGHIEAVKFFSDLRDYEGRMICFHFSGGTTEAVLCDTAAQSYEIVGGSRDLAIGQVLDRAGVSMGFPFPSGEYLDKIALKKVPYKPVLTPIKVKEGYCNYSGIETQAQRAIASDNQNELIHELFDHIGRSIVKMTLQLNEIYNTDCFIFAGGVSSSLYIREYLTENLPSSLHTVFGKPEYSTDNAVGTALLGGKVLWR